MIRTNSNSVCRTTQWLPNQLNDTLISRDETKYSGNLYCINQYFKGTRSRTLTVLAKSPKKFRIHFGFPCALGYTGTCPSFRAWQSQIEGCSDWCIDSRPACNYGGVRGRKKRPRKGRQGKKLADAIDGNSLWWRIL